MANTQSRRRFLAGASMAGGFLAAPSLAVADSPPETNQVRLPAYFKLADCQVGEYFAADILRAEGFSDIRWVETGTGGDSSDWMEHDEIDFDWNYPWQHVRSIAAGIPITVLGSQEFLALDAGKQFAFFPRELRSFSSLSSRVFWSVIPVILILSVVVGAANVYEFRQLITQEFMKRGASMATNLAYSSELGVFSEDQQLLEASLRGVLRDTDTVYAAIYGEGGKLLASRNSGAGG